VTFVGNFLSYSAVVGQIPFLDLIWNKNPLKLKWEALGLTSKVFPVTKFALDRAAERQDAENSTGRVDLLSKFKEAQEKHEFMTDQQVLSSCTSMIFAGSETTAISLSSIFYHLAKHPRVYEKLMAELDASTASGMIADRANRQVSWTEAQQLPYLEAVIQEAFRMHPAPGLILERYTPQQGIEICGQYIPGGVIVGCNAWVVHRRKEVFGEDVDVFRPERWIEASPEQLKTMNAAMFQFGAGSRTCIGKNISLLEIYKLVPTFLRNFKVGRATRTYGHCMLTVSRQVKMDCDDWKTHNGWFVTQKEFWTRFEPRERPITV
jgi:cytochrome P450